MYKCIRALDAGRSTNDSDVYLVANFGIKADSNPLQSNLYCKIQLSERNWDNTEYVLKWDKIKFWESRDE